DSILAKYRISKKETAPPPQETRAVEVVDPLPAQFEGLEPVNKLPPELREAVARAVLIDGKAGRDVAKEYGVGKNAVTACVREFFSEFVDQRNMALVGQLDAVTEEMLLRIRENIQNIPLNQLVVSFGILLDKRKDLINRITPSPGGISLKIAWKDGSGAIELTAGGSPGTGDPSPGPVFKVHSDPAGLDPDHYHGEVIDVDATPTPASSPPPDATDNEDDLW
ncbi:MAG: hypothetical protein K6T65_17055, partial [Peptococcaceae bacterium]|nr:hypothetical protein [Peptococcaceae bacterium]